MINNPLQTVVLIGLILVLFQQRGLFAHIRRKIKFEISWQLQHLDTWFQRRTRTIDSWKITGREHTLISTMILSTVFIPMITWSIAKETVEPVIVFILTAEYLGLVGLTIYRHIRPKKTRIQEVTS